MKLENINSSKFQDFKDDILIEAFTIYGGAPYGTSYKVAGGNYGTDVRDDNTDNGWKDGDKKIDWTKTCNTVPLNGGDVAASVLSPNNPATLLSIGTESLNAENCNIVYKSS